MSNQAVVIASRREAGDSIDFHARHGRALHARAAREGLETLLARFRSWRHRRIGSRRGWQVEWPAEPRASQCGRL